MYDSGGLDWLNIKFYVFCSL